MNFDITKEEAADIEAGKSVSIGGYTLRKATPPEGYDQNDSVLIPVHATPRVPPTWTDAEMFEVTEAIDNDFMKLRELAARFGIDKYNAMLDALKPEPVEWTRWEMERLILNIDSAFTRYLYEDYNEFGRHKFDTMVRQLSQSRQDACKALMQMGAEGKPQAKLIASQFRGSRPQTIVINDIKGNWTSWDMDLRTITAAATKGDGEALCRLMANLGRPKFDTLVQQLTPIQQAKVLKAVNEVTKQPERAPAAARLMIYTFAAGCLLAALLHMWGVV